MKKVLFVCVHNAARSQMAEAFLNRLGSGLFIAESSGLEPGELNPDIVEVMQEIGYDISQNKTKSVFDFYKEGRRYHYVVKVCDQMSGQKCPVFPATLKVLDWNHEDPAQYTGSKEERLIQARILRDEIKKNVSDMINRELIQSFDYKQNNKDELDFCCDEPNKKIVLDIEHLRVIDEKNDVQYGVKESDFDNVRFKLESFASLSVANWLLVVFGKSMLKYFKLESFNRNHVVGLLNSLVDNFQLKPNDIGYSFTENLHFLADQKGFNVKNTLRKISLEDKMNIDITKEFIVSSLTIKTPLVLLSHSDALLVYGIEDNDFDTGFKLYTLLNGEKYKLDLMDWVNKTNTAFIVKIVVE